MKQCKGNSLCCKDREQFTQIAAISKEEEIDWWFGSVSN
jgi:hypothetical protein